MNRSRVITIIGGFVIGALLLGVLIGGYCLYRNQTSLQQAFNKLTIDSASAALEKQIDIPQTQVVEKVVAKTEIWRPIQEQVKDTVVQVFCHKVEIDLLRPYRTPSESGSCGSGFFINESGEIITNAHVINQARSIWIQIPSLGKRIIDVELVGMSPDRDLALLRVKPESLAIIQEELGSVPYLELGDSDSVRRSDEVMALGYPLGQQSLKSTTGVISGHEQGFIQMSAAINPGNSGGPLLNVRGEVVGINARGIVEAQNVGYIIPINDLRIILDDLHKVTLLRKPYLGVFYNNGTESLTEFLGNPQPGGCYVVEVIKDSPLYKAGVQRGDMLYEIDGHNIDIYGEMNVPWSEDKISVINYVSRISIGQEVGMVVYRKGIRKDITVTFDHSKKQAIHKIYPGLEKIEYEVMCGMVVMPLTLNHVHRLMNAAPGLVRYAEMQNQAEPALIITHIFPSSELHRSRAVTAGSTLTEVNGMPVKTLDDFRAAIKSAVGSKFLTFKVADNILRTTEHMFVALPFDKVLEQEPQLAHSFNYRMSDTVKELFQAMEAQNTPEVATA